MCVIFLELGGLLRICAARISLIFHNFAGWSTAVLGNKVALFKTWQAALQLCLGMGLIWLELGRYPHSNAEIRSFIRLQFGSLICSHVAGISLIRLQLGRLLCGCAEGISLICVKLGSLLCSSAGIRLVTLCLHPNPIFNGPIRVKTTFLTKTRNRTGTVTSPFQPTFQWPY